MFDQANKIDGFHCKRFFSSFFYELSDKTNVVVPNCNTSTRETDVRGLW